MSSNNNSSFALEIGPQFSANKAFTCKGDWILLLSQKKSIQFFNLTNNISIEFDINASQKSRLIQFGNKFNPFTLILCTKDSVTSYKFKQAFDFDLELVEERLIASDIGKVSFIALDQNDCFVAVSVLNKVYIFDLINNFTTILEGHGGNVTVWDIMKKTCIYQSSIISAHPFTAIDIDPRQDRNKFCLGSEDGYLRFYDYSQKTSINSSIEPRLLTVISDLEVQISKEPSIQSSVNIINSVSSWRQSEQQQKSIKKLNENKDVCMNVNHSPSVLTLHYTPSRNNCRLIVGFSKKLLVLNVDNYQILFRFEFGEQTKTVALAAEPLNFEIKREEIIENNFNMLPLVGTFGFSFSEKNENVLYIATKSCLSKEVNILKLTESFVLGDKSNFLPSISYNEKLLIPCKGESLSHYLERLISTQVKGNWAENILKDCLLKLNSFNINSITAIRNNSDFLNVLNKIEGLPSFVLKNLENICLGGENVTFDSKFSKTKVDFITALDMPLNTESPLHYVKNKPNIRSSKAVMTKCGFVSKKQLGSLNQPITFRSKVKSSGYSASPAVNKLFTKPKISKRASQTSISPASFSESNLVHKYELLNTDTRLILSEFNVQPHAAPVVCLKYHSLGNFFASSSVDKTARTYLTRKNSSVKTFIGHSSGVTEVAVGERCIKNLGYPILTLEGGNSLVRFWGTEKSDPLILIGAKPKPVKPKPKTENTFYRIQGIKFFNHDELLVFARGPILQFATYNIHKPDPGSIQPNMNSLYNSCKVVGQYSTEADNILSKPSITSIACMNTVNSHLVIYATSDKKLSLFDVNAGKNISYLENAMKRAINNIALADYYSISNYFHPEMEREGSDEEIESLSVELNNNFKIGLGVGNSGFHNMFSTSAISDSIKLWDLRNFQPVLHLHGHINRLGSVGASLSPCGRFVLTGSEDNQAYIYDIRKASVLCKLSGGHNDIVSAVDFNPINAEVITGVSVFNYYVKLNDVGTRWKN
ncbi:WD repeat-containing protein 27 [Clydaea vesicula]|uniref:WD repeat-containing protein 27 n=1 Tax=Clydaea vesicula TaxID=447962 RepID=A0AAD5U7D1_9FUNG|nr:WD repeat-containing protein 27 [Clydaea vesicula]